jgi:uncharacterized membrane protein
MDDLTAAYMVGVEAGMTAAYMVGVEAGKDGAAAEITRLREQLRIAREGLEEIANRRTERRHEATRIIARDTLARMDAMEGK